MTVSAPANLFPPKVVTDDDLAVEPLRRSPVPLLVGDATVRGNEVGEYEGLDAGRLRETPDIVDVGVAVHRVLPQRWTRWSAQ